jgi:hypothetical protein
MCSETEAILLSYPNPATPPDAFNKAKYEKIVLQV